MGAKTKEVGGGPATGLANDFVGQLQNMLSTGTFGTGSGSRPRPDSGSGGLLQKAVKAFNGQSVPGGPNPGNSDPVGQTQGFGDSINKFISGDFGNTDTSALKDMAKGGGFNFADFNPEKVDLSGFNTDALKGFKSGIAPGSSAAPTVTGNSDFMSSFSQLMNGPSAAGKVGAQKGDVSYNLGNVDISPYEAKLARDKTANVANLRARFGAAGGNSFGTPAAVAEGNYVAAQDAENATALANIGREQQKLSLDAQHGAATVNAQNYGTWLQNITNATGIDNDRLASGLDTLARGIGTDAANFVNMRGQDLDAQIAEGKLSLEAISKATQLDLDTIKTAIDQNMSIADLLNQNQNIRANNQSQNRGLDIEALSKALQLDETGRANNLGAQGDMLSKLISMLGGLSEKGISQRQTVQEPGLGQQILGAATGIAGAAAPFFGPAGMLAGAAVNRAAPSFTPKAMPDMTIPTFGSNVDWRRK